jgi:hypothetical protein
VCSTNVCIVSQWNRYNDSVASSWNTENRLKLKLYILCFETKLPIHNRLHDTNRAVIRTNENPNFPVPSILETYGSMSTSWMWSYEWAWYNLNVESSLKYRIIQLFSHFLTLGQIVYLIETQTPSPVAAICRIWLSFLGWASRVCMMFKDIGSTICILFLWAAHTLSPTTVRHRTDCFGEPKIQYTPLSNRFVSMAIYFYAHLTSQYDSCSNPIRHLFDVEKLPEHRWQGPQQHATPETQHVQWRGQNLVTWSGVDTSSSKLQS